MGSMVRYLASVAFVFAAISSATAGTACTFTTAADAIKKKATCSTIILKNIQVPAKQTLDLTGLKPGTKVTFQGETTFGYALWEGPLISISGTKITVVGAAGSVLNGDGARWWDGKGANGGKKKPKFFQVNHLDSSSITGITIKNAPVQIFSITANELTLRNITINNADGDAKGGHNTDGFDIGNSKGIYIYNPKVHNQDDCLAINSGQNILFTGAECVGGHGISIGSVGGRSNNIVKNVTVSHSSITNSQNGVRVKTVYGATGSVSQITYSDIKLSGITNYGVVIQQDYQNGKPTGNATNGVKIDGLTLDHVTGSVASKAVPVYLLCGKASCTNWTWKSVSVSGGKAPPKCTNAPSGIAWTGVKCPK